MKNVLKVLGIIALVAVMGFSFAACNSGDDGDDEGGSPTDPGTVPGGNGKTLSSIAITTQPTKTQYYVGDTLDTTGMVVTATYSDNTTAVISSGTGGYTISGFNSTAAAASQTVTVTYQGKTATFTVTITARPKVATPTANPAGGTLVAAGATITLATTTDSAEIWYTTNGNAPAKNDADSTKFTAAFAITPPVTVKAIAVKTDWTNSDVLEAVYPATTITVADISIVAPTKNGIPATHTFSQKQERFDDGPITWSPVPVNNKFLGETVYTATITLTADPGYTFTGLTGNVKINGDNATIESNTGNTLTLKRTFTATEKKEGLTITLVTQPTKLNYNHGELINLAGLKVHMTYDDGTEADILAADFGTKGITTDPGHDIPLERFTYNNIPVKITYGNLSVVQTNNLTVNPINITGNNSVEISAISPQTYNQGTAITPTVTVGFKAPSGTTRAMTLTTDYTVGYTNNTNAGTATVTITGAGDYTGTKTATFTINKADPVQTWPVASNIIYGQKLSNSEFSGSQASGGGTFEWDAPDTVPNDVGTFQYDVKYVLPDSVKGNYNDAGKQKVSITVTAIQITEADIAITAPSTGATPAQTATNANQERFTIGTITWTPAVSTFAASADYTATVTLTAKKGYTFTGLNEDNIVPTIGTIVGNSIVNNGNTLSLTISFNTTGTIAVKSIAVTTQPTTTYTHGDALDLSDLEVLVTYNDNSTESVAFTGFETNSISVSPVNGRPLVRVTDNGHPVTITLGNATATTNNLTVNAKDISGDDIEVEVTGGITRTYTGDDIEPSLNVQFAVETSDRVLSPLTDYDVAYTDNLNAGQATITITGKGNYSGTKTEHFTITAIDVTDSSVSINVVLESSYTYDGNAVEPVVTVTFNAKTLTKDTHYTVQYSNNTDAGQATITIAGKHPNFTNSTTRNFNIGKATPAITTPPTASSIIVGQALRLSHLSNGVASVSGTFSWTDDTIEIDTIGTSNQEVTFTPNDTTNYNNVTGISVQVIATEVPITVADVSVTPPATGALPAETGVIGEESERFTPGTVVWSPTANTFAANTVYTVSVTLVADDGYTFTGISEAKVKINGVAPTSITNHGNTLILTYTFGATDARAVKSFAITSQPSTRTYTHGEALSLSGLVVTLTYNDNSTEAVTFTSSEAFLAKGLTAAPADGTQLEHLRDNNKPVTISHAGIADKTTGNLTVAQASASDFVVTMDSSAAEPYTGQPITWTISSVKFSTRTLTENTDYTTSYNGTNINAGTATLTITGINDYTGTKTETFTISKLNFNGPTVITIAAQPFVANADNLTFSVRHSGVLLEKGANKDYTVAYSAGVTNGDAAVGTTVTITITGHNNYDGTKTATFTVTKDIADSSITVEAIYTPAIPGDEEDPEDEGTPESYVVIVKDGGTTLTENTHYTLDARTPANGDNPATVTITGEGNYFGTRSVEFVEADQQRSGAPVSPVQSKMGMPPSFQKLLAK